jgi:hypothetical protein
MKRDCDFCHRPYEAKRPKSRFCGPACRVASARRKAPGTADQDANLRIETLVDPDSFDARAVLATIGADPNQPGAVRVAACRIFLGVSDAQPNREDKAMSLLDRRTQEILARRVH